MFIEKDLSEQLTLTLGGAITDGKYKDFIVGNGQDRSGEAFYYSPKYKASVGGIYRLNERLTFNTDVTYQSSAPSAYEFDSAGKVNGERRSDNYVLANFSSEFKVTKNVAVSGFVKNAFDKRYVTNNRDDEIIDAGAPRTFGMALRYDL